MAPKAYFRTATVTASLLLAFALSVAAGPYPSLADQWNAGLQKVDQELREKNWQAAKKEGRKVAYRIAGTAGSGDGAAYSLAVASALRAIAAAGLGDADDAAWHWDVALNLFPDVAKTKVSVYGPAAEELKKRQLRDPGSDIADQLAAVQAHGLGPMFPDPKNENKAITPPRVIKSPRPEYPRALELQGATGLLVVSTVIYQDGRPRDPVVLDFKGGGPAMKYVALDSLNDWRFEPAKLDGKPVAVFYVLSVNFKTKG
jgi:Gram-negative bacterial TonB protein C-terminal